jgi:hypothetical protein
MKRYLTLGPAFAVVALGLVLATVPGCPNPAKPPAKGPLPAPSDLSKGAESSGKKKAFVAKTTDGVIKGKVVYDGTPPKMAELKMEGHADVKACHQGPTTEQTWIVGQGNGVANVAVFLEPPDGEFFAFDEKQVEKLKTNPTLDQPHCVYEPAVIGIFAGYKSEDGKVNQTGAKLMVKNSSTNISHNTKVSGEGKYNETRSENIAPGNTKGIPYDVNYQKSPLSVVCDKHTWMKAKIVPFDHPFFAMTDKDGNFAIKNAPTGDFTIKTWHEEGTPASTKVSVKSGDNDAGTLKIKAGS